MSVRACRYGPKLRRLSALTPVWFSAAILLSYPPGSLAEEMADKPLFTCFGLNYTLLAISVREKLCGIERGSDDAELSRILEEQKCSTETAAEIWAALRRIRNDDYAGLQINPESMRYMLDYAGGCEIFVDPVN